jgi:dihydrofolate synthase/folylpolyglutamate synthase
VLLGLPQVILDVAHNPHAARALAATLGSMPAGGNTLAVCAMFKDKDIAGVVAAVSKHITRWFVADADGARGASADYFAAELARAGVSTPVAKFPNVAAAWHAACELASDNDKILVFGSFLTVAAVLRERQRKI